MSVDYRDGKPVLHSGPGISWTARVVHASGAPTVFAHRFATMGEALSLAQVYAWGRWDVRSFSAMQTTDRVNSVWHDGLREAMAV